MSEKERKKKRGGSYQGFFRGFDALFESNGEGSLGGRYSISVTRSGGQTVVRAKVSETVNREDLRKKLEAQYPGTRIIVEGGPS